MAPASNTCHLFIAELIFRDSSALNGCRLILGGSVLKAVVFIIETFFCTLESFKALPSAPSFLSVQLQISGP